MKNVIKWKGVLAMVVVAGVVLLGQVDGMGLRSQAVAGGQGGALVLAKAGSGIDWEKYEAGLSKAQRTNKPVFLYFHADWCTYCRQLKQKTFSHKDVQAYLAENYISISVDTDKNPTLANEWKVRGLPTLWFLEADGNPISNLPGYVEPDQFLNILKYIKTKSYDSMTFQEFVQKG